MNARRRLALALCLAAAPEIAWAAGYGIYEQGAAVLGMAGAGTASVSDASAVFYNPAALSRLEGTHLFLGGAGLTPFTSFAGANPYPGFGVTEEMKHRFFPIPNVYLARRWQDRLSLGLGVDSPFGLGTEWKDPDQFTGRYIATKAELKSVNTGLAAAYAVNRMVSVALGGDAMFAKVELRRRTLVPRPGGGGAQVDVAETRLESDYKSGLGWNAGVSVVPNDRVRLGATYRSKVIVDAEGDATFRQIPTGDPVLDALVAASLPRNQGVSTTLRFPAIWALGGAWTPSAWTIEADLVYTEWSLFEDLPLHFERDSQLDQTIVEDYDNTLAIRVGAEHRLAAYTYRFGYYFEQEAAPSESVSPILPDAARHGATLGLGKTFGPDRRWTIDLYDLGLFVEKRSTNSVNRDDYNGTYKTFLNALGLSLDYHW